MVEHKTFFTPEKIQKNQEDNIRLLNLAAIDFGNAIRECIPPCADQVDCMRLLRQIVYFGEAAIKLRGDV